ncbi:MAG: DUF5689 domain-containing protein [Flavobacteriaceae bacterium]
MKRWCFVLWLVSACSSSVDLPDLSCKQGDWIENQSMERINEVYQYDRVHEFQEGEYIKGVVVSSDEFGGFYKELVLQESFIEAKQGLMFWMDQRDVFLDFDLGQELYVNLSGLGMGSVYGKSMIGRYYQGELIPINQSELGMFFQKSCEEQELIPLVYDGEIYTNVLMHFPVVHLDSTQTLGYASNKSRVHELWIGDDCGFPQDQIDFEVSGYADFRFEKFPSNLYGLIGVVSNVYGNEVLQIRNKEDLVPLREPCSLDLANYSISELKEEYEIGIHWLDLGRSRVVDLVFIAGGSGNFDKVMVLQEPGGDQGLRVKVEDPPDLEVGQRLRLNLSGFHLKVDGNGEILLGSLKNDEIHEVASDLLPSNMMLLNYIESPGVRSVEVMTEDLAEYSNILLELKEVEFSNEDYKKTFGDFWGEEDHYRTFLHCLSETIVIMKTVKSAEHRGVMLPESKVNLRGVFSQGVFQIRDLEDVSILGPRENCIIRRKEVIISEVADPLNDVRARFVELTNLEDNSVSLDGWMLKKYINGSVQPSGNGLSLDGLVLGPGESIVLANTGFQSYFSQKAELISSYISGNGDDVYGLYDSSGELRDLYGSISQDGSTALWNYKDGRAVRKPSVTKGSSEFDVDEWDVLVNQLFPGDYNPWFF